jgi:hypothetical protein
MTSREPKQSLDITSRRSEAVDLPAASAYAPVAPLARLQYVTLHQTIRDR